MLNDDYEKVKKTGDIYARVALTIIAILTIFVIIVIIMIKSFFTKKEYFVLDVNDKNRDKVIELFKNEKENISYNKNYCDTIYKIEYHHLFPDGTEYTMYCKDEDNISFSIDKVGKDTLQTFIYENGKREIK